VAPAIRPRPRFTGAKANRRNEWRQQEPHLPPAPSRPFERVTTVPARPHGTAERALDGCLEAGRRAPSPAQRHLGQSDTGAVEMLGLGEVRAAQAPRRQAHLVSCDEVLHTDLSDSRDCPQAGVWPVCPAQDHNHLHLSLPAVGLLLPAP
jgi:hypothetical protein